MHAYCFASGQIGFGDGLPAGALPIARGEPSVLIEFIKGVARRGYAGETLFVPGLPEAASQEEALVSLEKFTKSINEKLPAGVSTIYSHAARAKGLDSEAATTGSKV
ncbi:hypothetical protein ACVIGB_001044 [Bradyrhizobium sp. USDA 4341]